MFAMVKNYAWYFKRRTEYHNEKKIFDKTFDGAAKINEKKKFFENSDFLARLLNEHVPILNGTFPILFTFFFFFFLKYEL